MIEIYIFIFSTYLLVNESYLRVVMDFEIKYKIFLFNEYFLALS